MASLRASLEIKVNKKYKTFSALSPSQPSHTVQVWCLLFFSFRIYCILFKVKKKKVVKKN